MKEQRVYHMVRLAIFEEEHKEQLEGARGFFRSDYIGRQMLRTALLATAAYLLILGGWGLLNVEHLIIDMTEIRMKSLVTQILFFYAVFLLAMLTLTYCIQNVRYARARKDLEQYQKMLKVLEKSYQEEEEANRVRQIIRKAER